MGSTSDGSFLSPGGTLSSHPPESDEEFVLSALGPLPAWDLRINRVAGDPRAKFVIRPLPVIHCEIKLIFGTHTALQLLALLLDVIEYRAR